MEKTKGNKESLQEALKLVTKLEGSSPAMRKAIKAALKAMQQTPNG